MDIILTGVQDGLLIAARHRRMSSVLPRASNALMLGESTTVLECKGSLNSSVVDNTAANGVATGTDTFSVIFGLRD